MTAPTVAAAPELTAGWLSAALGREVRDVSIEQVGTGQIGSCFRVRALTDDEPVRMLAKLPAPDPAMRQLLAIAYRNEVRFYTDLADTVAMRVPRCHYAAIDADGATFTLLLDDLSPAAPGDQTRSCTLDQAVDAVTNLVGLHAPRWCDRSLLDIDGLTLNGPAEAALMVEPYAVLTEQFVERLGHLLAPGDDETLRRCASVIARWIPGRGNRFGLIHGDYRLDNMLFPPGGAAGVVAVDFQTLGLGLPARDLAFFLATGLGAGQRRAHERDLVGAYHRGLVAAGVSGYSAEECWDDYRFALLHGPVTAVLGSAYATRTDRGDRMFATMVSRSCAAIRDLDTIELVAG